jgi:thiopeptide-type bacteriocin biosynthesis protein
MFPLRQNKVTFFPGEEWLYYKIYMGPESCDIWIREKLPELIAILTETIPGFEFFFVRYLDPDSHLRLRLRVPNSNQIGELIHLMNQICSKFVINKRIWKTEISTYVREDERYGANIEIFERAFCYDSQFWIKVLSYISKYNEFESLRWRLALASMYLYYSDFLGAPENWLTLLTRVIKSLEDEIRPSASFLYQVDKKYRDQKNRMELYVYGSGLTEIGISELFADRSVQMRELFSDLIVGDQFFETAKGIQNLTDLVHMSLNRGFRSKHRVQELVLYKYLFKMAKARIAKEQNI